MSPGRHNRCFRRKVRLRATVHAPASCLRHNSWLTFESGNAILAVSQDESLLVTRSEVLRRANAEVVAARADEAKKLLRERQFDLVVLCHSLTPEQTDELASLAHQLTSDVNLVEVLKIGELICGRHGHSTAMSQPKALIAKVTEILSSEVM